MQESFLEYLANRSVFGEKTPRFFIPVNSGPFVSIPSEQHLGLDASNSINVPRLDSPFKSKPLSMRLSESLSPKKRDQGESSTTITCNESSDLDESISPDGGTPRRKFIPSIEKLRGPLLSKSCKHGESPQKSSNLSFTLI